MLIFRRPAEHPDFGEDVKDARAAIENAVKDGIHPLPFDERLWKREKYHTRFYKAQHGKCGYCEVKLTGLVGQMDHFRPKGAVWELPDEADAWGEEIDGGTNVHGRRIAREHRGYHWLAYSWDNYVLSCERCNSGWKRAYFPVVEKPRRGPPDANVAESTWLIHPFDGPDPVDYLHFNDIGMVVSRGTGRYGMETIRTYGLHRPSLVEVRAPIARRVHHQIQTFLLDVDEAQKQAALVWLEDFGGMDQPHAGMVRMMFEQATTLRWASVFPDDPTGSASKPPHGSVRNPGE
jgi:uncharacterized protein (DUF952 family)